MRNKPLFITALVVCLAAGTLTMAAQTTPRRKTPRMTSGDVTTQNAPTAPSGAEAPAVAVEPMPAETGGAIAWERDLGRALRRAKATGGVVVVDVYTDWCGWCKKMDKTTYADPKVVALSRREVFVKLDAEDGGEGQQFARGLRVTSYPTTFVLDGDGRPLTVARGYIKSGDDFLAMVEKARALLSGGR